MYCTHSPFSKDFLSVILPSVMQNMHLVPLKLRKECTRFPHISSSGDETLPFQKEQHTTPRKVVVMLLTYLYPIVLQESIERNA